MSQAEACSLQMWASATGIHTNGSIKWHSQPTVAFADRALVLVRWGHALTLLQCSVAVLLINDHADQSAIRMLRLWLLIFASRYTVSLQSLGSQQSVLLQQLMVFNLCNPHLMITQMARLDGRCTEGKCTNSSCDHHASILWN